MYTTCKKTSSMVHQEWILFKMLPEETVCSFMLENMGTCCSNYFTIHNSTYIQGTCSNSAFNILIKSSNVLSPIFRDCPNNRQISGSHVHLSDSANAGTISDMMKLRVSTVMANFKKVRKNSVKARFILSSIMSTKLVAESQNNLKSCLLQWSQWFIYLWVWKVIDTIKWLIKLTKLYM